MTPLRQQMIDAMQVRGLAVRTQEAYVDALARMARHFGRSPAELDAVQIEAYMLHLSKDLRRSFSTINQVSAASRFLWRHVLKREDSGLKPPVAHIRLNTCPRCQGPLHVITVLAGQRHLPAPEWTPPSRRRRDHRVGRRDQARSDSPPRKHGFTHAWVAAHHPLK